MNEEQWNELLKLCAKASLTPKSDHHYSRLEEFFSSHFYLATYSQDEITHLLAQFENLSDQEKQDILSRARWKTNPSFFHLTNEEVEKVRAARKELSFHERARLFSNLILTWAGTAWLDLGDVFEAEIEIDDHSSPARGTRPYAHIYFTDSCVRRVETIDIIESVRTNPASVGHPVIVFAISHWQRIIYAKRVIERDDVTTRDELGKICKDVFGGGREVRIAERNIEAISKALVNGAKERAIPNEPALALKMKLLGLGLEDKNTVLYKAWERLSPKFVERTDEKKQVLAKIEAYLIAHERQPYINNNNGLISAHRVMEFVRAGGQKGGKKYVGYNREGKSLKPRWKVFRNAFAAWFFGLSSVQPYLKKAAKKDIDVDDVYQPSWVTPKSNVPHILHYLFSTPLVMAREPVKLAETDLNYQGIEKAIEEATSKTAGGEGGK